MTEKRNPLDEQLINEASDVADEDDLPTNTPSPREILERSLEIQEGWTKDERCSREHGQCVRDAYEVPEVASYAKPKIRGGVRGAN